MTSSCQGNPAGVGGGLPTDSSPILIPLIFLGLPLIQPGLQMGQVWEKLVRQLSAAPRLCRGEE